MRQLLETEFFESPYAKISPEMVNPGDLAGKTEDVEVELDDDGDDADADAVADSGDDGDGSCTGGDGDDNSNDDNDGDDRGQRCPVLQCDVKYRGVLTSVAV